MQTGLCCAIVVYAAQLVSEPYRAAFTYMWAHPTSKACGVIEATGACRGSRQWSWLAGLRAGGAAGSPAAA